MLARSFFSLCSRPRGRGLSAAVLARLASFAVVAVLAAISAPRAHAQILDQYLPVGIPGYEATVGAGAVARAQTEYTYPGIDAAGVTVRPQISQGIGYNDNVFGTNNPKGSVFEETAGTVTAVSDYSAAELAGYMSVDDTRFFSATSQNTTDATISASGSYTFRQNDLATLAYSHLFENETGTDIGAIGGGIQPVFYNVDDLRASYLISGARITLTPLVEYTAYRFDNTTQGAATVIETYRNRDLLTGSLTGTYELAPLEDLVAVVRGTNTHYVTKIPGFLTSDSNSITGLFGIDFSATGVIEYRALIGYQQKNYFGSGFQNRSSPVFEGGVVWTPTLLTTVRGTVTRRIEDASADDTVGYTYTELLASVDHEYLRNVLLNGHGSFQVADFAQHGGTQDIYGAGGSVTWLLNRYLKIAATYDFTRSSISGGVNSATFDLIGGAGGNTGGSGSYTRNLAMVKLIFGGN